MPDLNPEQFGISQHEAAEIKGNALGGHLWESMEGILGNMRVQNQSNTYDELSHRFGAQNVNIDAYTGSPYFEVHQGPHSLRYYGGATLNYYKHGQNVDASTTYEHGNMLSSDFQNRLHRWVEEDSEHY